MNKLVVLSLGQGDLVNGFPAVTVQLWEHGNPHPMKFTGGLPKAPEIAELYRYWQLLYEALYRRLDLCPRLEIEESDVTNVSEVEFGDLCQRLSERINAWFNSEEFRNLDQRLRTQLNASEEICLIIETNDHLLRRIPWHLWKFFEDYPQAEVALSAAEYQRQTKSITKTPGTKVRILALLGNSKGIDIGKDRGFLEELSDKAHTEFLVEPQAKELNDQLWDQGWDILFFAGHSSSQEKGLLQLSQTHSLTLEQLRYALKKAIERGLKLAIFNSCDGLGLAQQLEDLHIPQVIVMREPVPDRVAQEFLRHFLQAFSKGQSLYASVREARERLQKLESEYPCATWLPVICQNPAEVPTTWQEWCGEQHDTRDHAATWVGDAPRRPNHQVLLRKLSLGTALLVSMVVGAAIMGIRHLGMLQTWELQAFDHLMRLRSAELPDQRILVVTVTEADIQAQNQEQRKGSVSDRALTKLLERLEPYQPRAIGLDIYRDFPVEPKYKDLATRLRQNDRFIAVCKVSDPKANDPGVPPPPEIPAERLGFSDVVVDSDGMIRRHLLALTPAPASPCTAYYSLSAQLTFRYLATEGIFPKFTAEGHLQLGSVVFKPLEVHTGGYQRVDAWGHQVLLNYRPYRSFEDIAPQVTLTQLLSGQINPNVIRDRIVLIGVTAESVHDYWSTPYSAGTMPGVLIQAQMVSQILSAVKDGRPLLWVWPVWSEALWVWGWAMVGGILAYRCQSSLYRGLMGASALGVLYGLCFCFLTQGGWVPLVPSALALVATGGSVSACITFQSQRQLYKIVPQL